MDYRDYFHDLILIRACEDAIGCGVAANRSTGLDDVFCYYDHVKHLFRYCVVVFVFRSDLCAGILRGVNSVGGGIIRFFAESTMMCIPKQVTMVVLVKGYLAK